LRISRCRFENLLLAGVALIGSVPSGPAAAHETPRARLAELSHALSENPGDASLYLLRGEEYRLSGHVAEASADYASAEALGADPQSLALCRAALALDRTDPALALDILAAPDDGAASPQRFRLQGRAYRDMGRFQAAAASFGKALAAAPHPRPGDYRDLAFARRDGGDPEGALAALDAGIRALGPVASLVSPAVDLEIAQGRPGAALDRLDALAASPANLARRGDILALDGQPLAAQAAYTDALERLDALPPARRHTPASTTLAARLHAALSGASREAAGDESGQAGTLKHADARRREAP
jgi:tetratricopeptide (TPR) repeat protein